MKRALICGVGGFVGSHLAKKLKKSSYFVRGIGKTEALFDNNVTDEYLFLDLREKQNYKKALSINGGFDEVYQLAADRGSAGYLKPKEADMMYSNVLVNAHMIDEAAKAHVKKYFFASSVCVYPNMQTNSKEITEEDAYPALPENEYGWEKLYSERMLLAYARKFPLEIRIGRFHTSFGPGVGWKGLKAKAPDDLCRKAILAPDGGELEVWGNDRSTRCFTFIEDLISGIQALMASNITLPTNIGSNEYVTINQLAEYIIQTSGKKALD